MGGLQFWFLIVASVLVVVKTKAVQNHDLEAILEKIPEEDRLPFLKHHINKGYELLNADNKGNLQILKEQDYLPDEFSLALYEMARKEHRIVDDAFLSLLGTIVCFPSGECIDIGDVGVHPRNQKQ